MHTAALVSSKAMRAISAASASSIAWCHTSVQSSCAAMRAVCSTESRPWLVAIIRIGRGAMPPPTSTSLACGRACGGKALVYVNGFAGSC